MSAVIQYLDDPYLVVKFQRYFGVIPNDKSGKRPVQNGVTPNAEVNKQEINGSANGTGISNGNTKSYTNGYIHQHISKNGTIQNENAVKHRSHKEQNGNITTEEKDNKKSIGWDMVSNQERGIDDKWETDEYIITNKPLYYLFNFGANLGNEIFYITFFPFWLWNIDSFVGRRVCIFWALFMYLGQVTKDLLKIPRPASPPVIRMEKIYALEYGMPSTHAMVGAGFPFSILLLTWQRYVYPFEYGLVVAILWTTIVCCSRLYLGMHSVLDLIGGLLYVFILLPIWYYASDDIDNFVLQSSYSPVVCLVVPLLLCIFYPKYDKWSPARKDTFIILAVLAGISFASWLNFLLGSISRAPGSPPYEIIYPDLKNLGFMFLRTVIGVMILLITRAITKLVGYNLFCEIFGLSKNDPNTKKTLCMEVSCKYLTYSLVAFNAIWLSPIVFRFLSIERDSSFTEV